MELKESSKDTYPLMGVKKTTCFTHVNIENLLLTRAVLSVTCEAAETEAGMVAYCVDTPG